MKALFNTREYHSNTVKPLPGEVPTGAGSGVEQAHKPVVVIAPQEHGRLVPIDKLDARLEIG